MILISFPLKVIFCILSFMLDKKDFFKSIHLAKPDSGFIETIDLVLYVFYFLLRVLYPVDPT